MQDIHNNTGIGGSNVGVGIGTSNGSSNNVDGANDGHKHASKKVCACLLVCMHVYAHTFVVVCGGVWWLCVHTVIFMHVAACLCLCVCAVRACICCVCTALLDMHRCAGELKQCMRVCAGESRGSGRRGGQ